MASACNAGSSIRVINEDGSVECEVDNDSGDVTSVLAGSGLTGGGVSGDLFISANFNTVQGRVTGTCATGKSIQSIGKDGTVVCHTDANDGGDITLVEAGVGLTGGGVTGDVAINVDATYVQRRVSACGTGSSIREIAQDGTVTCHTDADSGGDITNVAAGVGLTGGGVTGDVTIDVDTTYLQRRVVGVCGFGFAVRSIDATGAVVCGADADSGGDVTGVAAGFAAWPCAPPNVSPSCNAASRHACLDSRLRCPAASNSKVEIY